MATTKRSAKSETAVTAKVDGALDGIDTKAAGPPQFHPLAKVPSPLRFALATAMSFVIASLGYSIVSELSEGELASLSRRQDTWGELAMLVSWRITELAVAWIGNLDGLDVAAMDFLSHGPTLYLLTTFYSLSRRTALSALVVDVLSAAVPFAILRPLSDFHCRSKAARRELLDWSLQLYTATLATVIYTVTLILSLRFLLPRYLAIYFSGLPTLVPAYMASYGGLVPVMALFGVAASTFIFAPFAATGKCKEDDKLEDFDPVQATLGQTVWWNVWGYSAKTKVVIRRTTMAMFVTGINTFLACAMTVQGVQSTGAMAYAAVWASAVIFTGLGLGLVGRE
ncbi:hypothetical protein DCS_01301 [Drechmeria coniospora]|uniref:Uncharacterized protein n=1 Tax=Drechmeria coniospora TaxID=98403 RepID=A0A151GSR8_DRECN|nr:hypothetical protein DCS_01301 [Drechmeria coniospora]KYK60166.1 hypothetical protein DCS_01301 [Drechmeria coniospora]ODA80110.1 hypothetical protein RJ55_03068 [Drechmeria coniospora]